jgi:hypothetical protein
MDNDRNADGADKSRFAGFVFIRFFTRNTPSKICNVTITSVHIRPNPCHQRSIIRVIRLSIPAVRNQTLPVRYRTPFLLALIQPFAGKACSVAWLLSSL